MKIIIFNGHVLDGQFAVSAQQKDAFLFLIIIHFAVVIEDLVFVEHQILLLRVRESVQIGIVFEQIIKYFFSDQNYM